MTDSSYAFQHYINIVAEGRHLSEAEAEAAFEIVMSGQATQAQMGGFLMGLRILGETVDEITAAARIMRSKALAVKAPAGAMDTCGTGGDGSGSFNVSTGAGLVVAACGVPVAKHGNRALSSKCGSAEVLTELGVNIDVPVPVLERSLAEAGFCYMMAPRHHSATRHVAGPRVELGTRTIFNILGPLSNPAGVTRQLVGVFARDWVEPMARVLGNLGSEHVWVVHGSDGLDELTTTGPSFVTELNGGQLRSFEITPEDAGIARANPADLKGADSKTNAGAVRDMLGGGHGAYRDIVVYNAAASLIVGGRAADIDRGVALANDAIESGAALAVLEKVVAITNAAGAPADAASQ